MTPSQITLAVMVPIVVWRMYTRYRKLVGKQHVRPFKLWMSAILFPTMFLLVAYGAMGNSVALITLLAGGAAGIGLSVLGHRLTRFENTAGVLSYTPNAYIGLALLLLLSSRIAIRFFMMSNAAPQQGQAALENIVHNPFTTVIFGLLFCYYASYSIGILRWRHAQMNLSPSTDMTSLGV